MLKIRIISLLFLFSLVTEASFDEIMNKPSKQDEAKILKEKVGRLYRLKDVTKYGFVDKTGKWIVPPRFVYIEDYDKNGYALATMKGRRNIDFRWSFNKRLNSCSRVKDAQYGFINVAGEWIIEPKYECLNSFSDSFALAKTNGKSGFIDRNGGWHDTVKNIKQPNKEKLCKNEVGRSGNNIIIKEDNKTIVAVDQNCKPIAYFDNGILFVGAFLVDSGKLLLKDVKLKKFGIWDRNKHGWKIKPIFELDDAATFDFLAKKDGKWGVLSEDGTWKIKPQFHELTSFEDDGLARARNMNYKWGLIDQKGKWVVEPTFDDIGSLGDNGLLAAKKEYKGKYGYIDSTGKYYIDEKFDRAKYFREGYAEVENEKKCGYIDGHGKVIIDLKYDKCETEGANFLLTIDNKKGLLDKDNNWILKPLFDNINVIDEHMIKVEYGNYEGYTDITGKPLTFTMDEVENVINMK